MPKYLLDTNHCSRAILGDEKILNRLEVINDDFVCTCVIVQGELVDMAERSQRNQDNLALVQNFLQEIYIYDIDKITANFYGQIKASIFKQFAPKDKSKRRKTKIANLGFDENDLWLTAIAIQYKLTIVSSDSDFFRIQQVFKTISVESWV
jgi:tRNA(fMet)-specific endonuclease VapC